MATPDCKRCGHPLIVRSSLALRNSACRKQYLLCRACGHKEIKVIQN
jgi:RNase P subunit RPR2